MLAAVRLMVLTCVAATLLTAPAAETTAPKKQPAPRYEVSGHVANMDPAYRVRVVLSAPNKPNRVTTIVADGTYVFRNVPPGAYEVRPVHALYRFSPEFHTAAVTTQNVIHIDFTAWRLPQQGKKK
jgi:ER membrane protein complex subunit 7, beta-sandwich domain